MKTEISPAAAMIEQARRWITQTEKHIEQVRLAIGDLALPSTTSPAVRRALHILMEVEQSEIKLLKQLQEFE